MRQHRRVVRKYDANFRIMVMADKKLHKPLLLLTEMPLNTKYMHICIHKNVLLEIITFSADLFYIFNTIVNLYQLLDITKISIHSDQLNFYLY